MCVRVCARVCVRACVCVPCMKALWQNKCVLTSIPSVVSTAIMISKGPKTYNSLRFSSRAVLYSRRPSVAVDIAAPPTPPPPALYLWIQLSAPPPCRYRGKAALLLHDLSPNSSIEFQSQCPSSSLCRSLCVPGQPLALSLSERGRELVLSFSLSWREREREDERA